MELRFTDDKKDVKGIPGTVPTKKYPKKRAYHKGCFASSPIQKLNKTGGKK